MDGHLDDGDGNGDTEGLSEGCSLGDSDGLIEGAYDGDSEGMLLDLPSGLADGMVLGKLLGPPSGDADKKPLESLNRDSICFLAFWNISWRGTSLQSDVMISFAAHSVACCFNNNIKGGGMQSRVGISFPSSSSNST
jgi:hypothetical protein